MNKYILFAADYISHALEWLSVNVLTMQSLIQLSIIAAVILAAILLGHKIADGITKKYQHLLQKIPIHLNISMRVVMRLTLMLIMLIALEAILLAIGWQAYAVQAAYSIVLAWFLIRITTSVIKNPVAAKLIAGGLLVYVITSKLGLWSEITAFLQIKSITLGETTLSLYLIATAIFSLIIIWWLVGVIGRISHRVIDKSKGLTPSQKVLFEKISRITLYTVGALVALNAVGLDLSVLAVFSGALGLGIGFGLQKVFSNLISGIILLMDKSIKPGDVIAIDDTYGWVNTLGGRCISVITRDGKEHLIPNEELITSRVENWSYSDEKIRLHIPIGVAYKSDVNKVKELLLQSVTDHPRILSHPTPTAFITGFGDNSIDFQIRIWICDPAGGMTNLKSDIYFKIWQLFKDNDIEIPFPQRDVYLKRG